MAFRVGQKVVCVDDVFRDASWLHVKNMPVAGSIYTIRGFQTEKYFDGILLEEVINDAITWNAVGFREMSFPARRFRPVQERKTDISIFKKMLNPQKVDA